MRRLVFGLGALLAFGCSSEAPLGYAGDLPLLESQDCAAGETCDNDPEQALRSSLHKLIEQDPDDAKARAELAELDRQSNIGFGLLAEADDGRGHLAKFFEPRPGRIVIIERYRDGRAPTQLARTIESTWMEVAGDRPMPPQLQDLSQRQQDGLRQLEEMKASTGAAPSGPNANPGNEAASRPTEAPKVADVSLPLGTKKLAHVTSSGTHFRDAQNGCGLDSSADVQESWCWLSRTANWTESQSSVEAHVSAIAMYAGSLMTWQVRFGDSTNNETIQKGEFWTVNASELVCFIGCYESDEDAHGKVLDAQSNVDKWHWGGAFYSDVDFMALVGYTPNN